jgi:hypothetical protein
MQFFLENNLMKCPKTFARFTEDHDDIALELTPCAGFLYRWLLRTAPAGVPQEIELEAFRQKTNYSLKWIQSALNELIESDLVEIVKKYSGKIFKLITFHPGRETAQDLARASQPIVRTSKKQPSTADAAVPLYRDPRETTDQPTHHPVPRDGQEKTQVTPTILSSETSPMSQTQTDTAAPTIAPVSSPQPTAMAIANTAPTITPTPSTPATEMESSKTPQPIADTTAPQPTAIEISPEISEKIKIAGFTLNAALLAIVRTTAAQIVLDAIDAAKQYLDHLQRQNQPRRRQPEAILVAAIQDQWQPNRAESPTQAIPPEFQEWFTLAQSNTLVIASSAQADVTQHPPGMLCVLTKAEGWQPFDLMRCVYSIPRLRQMLAEVERLREPHKIPNMAFS